jgi:hypothetical protein
MAMDNVLRARGAEKGAQAGGQRGQRVLAVKHDQELECRSAFQRNA